MPIINKYYFLLSNNFQKNISFFKKHLTININCGILYIVSKYFLKKLKNILKNMQIYGATKKINKITKNK